MSQRSTTGLARFIALIGPILVGAACAGPPNADPTQFSPAALTYRAYIAERSGTPALRESRLESEASTAHTLWSSRCNISVTATTGPTRFNYIVNGQDAWEIHDVPPTTANLPADMQAVLNQFPPQGSRVSVYVVNRLVKAPDANGVRKELGGVAARNSNWLFLSGSIVGSSRRVMAHELGHNLGNPDIVDSWNLMHESVPPGDRIYTDQCNTAHASPISN